jgi:hypothetical protein
LLNVFSTPRQIKASLLSERETQSFKRHNIWHGTTSTLPSWVTHVNSAKLKPALREGSNYGVQKTCQFAKNYIFYLYAENNMQFFFIALFAKLCNAAKRNE